ncbi:MAG: hypothetical protein H8E86_07425 [Planctomycetes bacterium]|nr:hypothetical protein [Planctomycetota bacterium]
MYKRYGILTNMIAIVLIFTMSICCCIVNTATGSMASSYCTVEVTETKPCNEQASSCCQKQPVSEEDSENEPCCEECSCVIVGAIFTQNWVPPVDLIGVDTPTPFFKINIAVRADQHVADAIHGPPKYDQHTLGYSSTPSMRGVVILQV